jgi:hypothetical protein
LFGVSAWDGSRSPSVGEIQAAYDLELERGDARHDPGLRVVEATCESEVRRKFLCQISFVADRDIEQRLYFDVVEITANAAKWELTSGLCRPKEGDKPEG